MDRLILKYFFLSLELKQKLIYKFYYFNLIYVYNYYCYFDIVIITLYIRVYQKYFCFL